MLKCLLCNQDTPGFCLRRGGAVLVGVVVGDPVLVPFTVNDNSSVRMTHVGIADTSGNVTLDAVAFPMSDGRYFVTKGSLVKTHYSELLPYANIGVDPDTKCPFVPVMLLGQDQSLDVLTPVLLLRFNSEALIAGAVCAQPQLNSVAMRQHMTPCIQKFCSAKSVYVCGDSIVFLQVQRKRTAGKCNYLFTYNTRTRACSFNKINHGTFVLGSSKSHVITSSYDSETTETGRNISIQLPASTLHLHQSQCPLRVYMYNDSPLLCYATHVTLGGTIVAMGAFQSFSFDETCGVLCALESNVGEGGGKIVVVSCSAGSTTLIGGAGTMAELACTVDGISVMGGTIACVCWFGEGSDASASASASSSDSRPRKRSRSTSTEHTSEIRLYSLRALTGWVAFGSNNANSAPRAGASNSENNPITRIPATFRRAWAVQLLSDDRVVVGGNTKSVDCFAFTGAHLWCVDVGNVVLSFTWVEQTSICVAVTLDKMVEIRENATTFDVPHSSVDCAGLRLSASASFPASDNTHCPMCNQRTSVHYFPSSDASRNLNLRECPRLLGFYTGERNYVSEYPGQKRQLFGGEPCPCGSGKTYEGCHMKFHSEHAITSVDMGNNEDHTYLCTAGFGDFFIQHLCGIYRVRFEEDDSGTTPSALIRRLAGFRGRKYNPNTGAMLLKMTHGLGLANDAQYFATPTQYGLLDATRNNNASGITMLQPNNKNKLVPFSVAFFLWRTCNVEESGGAKGMDVYCEYGPQFTQ